MNLTPESFADLKNRPFETDEILELAAQTRLLADEVARLKDHELCDEEGNEGSERITLHPKAFELSLHVALLYYHIARLTEAGRETVRESAGSQLSHAMVYHTFSLEKFEFPRTALDMWYRPISHSTSLAELLENAVIRIGERSTDELMAMIPAATTQDRMQILSALDQRTGEKVLQILSLLTQDPDDDVREMAMFALEDRQEETNGDERDED